MSVDAVHPLYAEALPDQTLMQHTIAGEACIKGQDVKYLPPTPGMELDGMETGKDGRKKYDAYKSRASFPDYTEEAVEHLLGLLHQKPAVFELPKAMEPLLERASMNGEGLQTVLLRINTAQVTSGRMGVLADLPKEVDPANPMPMLALYESASIRNWDDSDDHKDMNQLKMLVLDESGKEREPGTFTWTDVKRYRVLEVQEGKYVQHVFKDSEAYDPALLQPPMLRGKALTSIPFAFVNAKDMLAAPGKPPLVSLARLCHTIYRSDADYRQTLFLQGQDTLVVIGGMKAAADGEEVRVGAGSVIETDLGGDAKYVGVSATGLPEMRQALENDHARAQAKSGELINNMSKGSAESGEALKTRLAAETATLKQIAVTSGKALENVLKGIAEWMGLNADEVVVKPNLEFADVSIAGKDMLDLVQAKNQGLPLSKKSLHKLLQERKLTEMEYEDEITEIEDEDPLLGTSAGGLLDKQQQFGQQQQQEQFKQQDKMFKQQQQTPPANKGGK